MNNSAFLLPRQGARSRIQQLSGGSPCALVVERSPVIVDLEIFTDRPAELFQSVSKCRKALLSSRVVLGKLYHDANSPNAIGLLRARGERPCRCCTAERKNEFPSSGADCHLTAPQWGHARYNKGKIITLQSAGL